MKHFTRQQIADACLEICREELRDRLMRFRETPLGRVVARAGRAVIQANVEGRKLEGEDIVQICDELCDVLKGGEDTERDNG